jgi:hypothetical protein
LTLLRRDGLPRIFQGATFPVKATTSPPALIDGEIAFPQHAGGHTTGPNWPTFLKFTDRYLKDRKVDDR